MRELLHVLIEDIALFVRCLTYAVVIGFILGAGVWTFRVVAGL